MFRCAANRRFTAMEGYTEKLYKDATAFRDSINGPSTDLSAISTHKNNRKA